MPALYLDAQGARLGKEQGEYVVRLDKVEQRFPIAQVERHPTWRGLRSIVAVTAERECHGKVSEETRYFICSLDAEDPKRLGQIVRAHWGIENKLHWVLDYAFDEDSQRNRKGNSAANMAVIRHIALNLNPATLFP